jgi:hypothetical protein
MGFDSIGAYTATDDAGQVWVTSFRKLVASATTPTSGWIDYSYYAGTPVANFYASAPYVSARLDADKGIYQPTTSPKTKHLKNLMLMSSAASATSVANARQSLLLCDYLLYYPFIDTDAVGEEQLMENTVAIPRYTSGKVIAVGQAAASTIGQFTMTYTNQDGVSGRVSQNNFTLGTLAGGGQVASTGLSANGYHPFVQLAAGDSGVRSIESVTFSAAGGGLMVLVIVKPIFHAFVTQECRRTTSANLESYGACDEFSSIIHQMGAPEIKDGAVLNFFAQGFAGSLASSALVGIIETAWN